MDENRSIGIHSDLPVVGCNIERVTWVSPLDVSVHRLCIVQDVEIVKIGGLSGYGAQTCSNEFLHFKIILLICG